MTWIAQLFPAVRGLATLLVAVIGIGALWGGPASVVSAASAQAGYGCSALSGETALLCRALEARQCSVAPGQRGQEFCRGLTARSCSYISDVGDQTLCRGIVGQQCSFIPWDSPNNALCHAVVRRDCQSAGDAGQIAFCSALVSATAG